MPNLIRPSEMVRKHKPESRGSNRIRRLAEALVMIVPVNMRKAI